MPRSSHGSGASFPSGHPPRILSGPQPTFVWASRTSPSAHLRRRFSVGATGTFFLDCGGPRVPKRICGANAGPPALSMGLSAVAWAHSRASRNTLGWIWWRRGWWEGHRSWIGSMWRCTRVWGQACWGGGEGPSGVLRVTPPGQSRGASSRVRHFVDKRHVQRVLVVRHDCVAGLLTVPIGHRERADRDLRPLNAPAPFGRLDLPIDGGGVGAPGYLQHWRGGPRPGRLLRRGPSGYLRCSSRHGSSSTGHEARSGESYSPMRSTGNCSKPSFSAGEPERRR